MKKCESYIIICDDVCGIVGRREVVQLLRIVHNIVPSLMLQSGAKKNCKLQFQKLIINFVLSKG